jgi:hypothetical protein
MGSNNFICFRIATLFTNLDFSVSVLTYLNRQQLDAFAVVALPFSVQPDVTMLVFILCAKTVVTMIILFRSRC